MNSNNFLLKTGWSVLMVFFGLATLASGIMAMIGNVNNTDKLKLSLLAVACGFLAGVCFFLARKFYVQDNEAEKPKKNI